MNNKLEEGLIWNWNYAMFFLSSIYDRYEKRGYK